MSKISGPLLDRIDIHIEVPAVPFKELASPQTGTSSVAMREQVVRARQCQQTRFCGTSSRSNAHMAPRQIRQYCRLNEECLALLKSSVQELGLSARAHDKILRVARTIADLDAADDIQYRPPVGGHQLPAARPQILDLTGTTAGNGCHGTYPCGGLVDHGSRLTSRESKATHWSSTPTRHRLPSSSKMPMRNRGSLKTPE